MVRRISEVMLGLYGLHSKAIGVMNLNEMIMYLEIKEGQSCNAEAS